MLISPEEGAVASLVGFVSFRPTCMHALVGRKETEQTGPQSLCSRICMPEQLFSINRLSAPELENQVFDGSVSVTGSNFMGIQTRNGGINCVEKTNFTDLICLNIFTNKAKVHTGI